MGSAIVLGLVYGSAYALLGLGIVLIYKGSRVFNFAQAEFGTVAAFTVYLARSNGLPYPIAIVLALVVAVLMGLGVERFVVQPLFDAPKVTLLVATAGVALGSIALQLFLGGAKFYAYAPAIRGTAFRPFGVATSWQQVLIVLALVGCALALAAFFNRTFLGLAVLAVASEPTAANLSGISVKRVSALVWGVAALLGGVAGVLGSALQEGGFSAGFVTREFLIFAFVGSVIGGIASLPGAVLGGLVLGVAQQLTLKYIGGIDWVQDNLPGSQEIMTFILLLVVLTFRPNGLLGKES